MRPQYLVVSAVALGLLALFPASVLAQSAIAGVVRDTSESRVARPSSSKPPVPS